MAASVLHGDSCQTNIMAETPKEMKENIPEDECLTKKTRITFSNKEKEIAKVLNALKVLPPLPAVNSDDEDLVSASPNVPQDEQVPIDHSSPGDEHCVHLQENDQSTHPGPSYGPYSDADTSHHVSCQHKE